MEQNEVWLLLDSINKVTGSGLGTCDVCAIIGRCDFCDENFSEWELWSEGLERILKKVGLHD